MNRSINELFTENSMDLNGTNNTESYAIGATIASPITMAMAGVVGNLLALVVLHKTKTEIRRMMFYTLVAALSCTDLAGILLTTPVTVAAYINRREMPGGIGLCKFNAFIMVCFGLATPLIVCAMAVERFLAIKCTYFYSKHCTPHNARITVVILWAFVFFFGALPLFGFGDFSIQFPNTWCFLNFHTRDLVFSIYGYMYAGVNLGIVILMTCCNVFVIVTLMRARYIKQTSISNSLLRESADEKRRLQTKLRGRKQTDVEMQMIWLMSAITTVFAVCWAPLMIHIVITLATGKSNPVLGLLAIRLASLNQTLDPWLYILLRKAFLKKILKTTRKIICAQSNTTQEIRECKRNQYVDVRRQLCHKNYIVGKTDSKKSPARSGDGTRSRSNLHDDRQIAKSLPDVMKTSSSGRSEPLPDVTNSLASAFIIPERVLSDGGSNIDSDSPECIYVDIFRILPKPGDISEMCDGPVSSNASNTPNLSLKGDLESEIFQNNECSSSGICSMNQGISLDLLRSVNSEVIPAQAIRYRENGAKSSV